MDVTTRSRFDRKVMHRNSTLFVTLGQLIKYFSQRFKFLGSVFIIMKLKIVEIFRKQQDMFLTDLVQCVRQDAENLSVVIRKP